MRSARKTAAERRLQVAHATLQLLAERGASDLTTQNIARRAGIKDGSLFRHFASKQEMVAAAVAEFVAAMEASFPPPDAEPLVQLKELFVRRATLARERPEVVRLAFNERLLEAADDVRPVREMVQRSLSFVKTCVEGAQAQGSVASDLPAQVLAWSVIGVLRGMVLASLDGQATAMSPDAAWRAVETLLRRSRTTPAPLPPRHSKGRAKT